MPGLLQRHPYFGLLAVGAVCFTFYVLSTPSSLSWNASPFEMPPVDVTLPARVQRANRIYDKVLADRKELIRKFGPTPEDVQMFPPDKEPWPAYTVWDFFPAAYNCPHEVERIGALGDGGKWVCGLSRVQEKKPCVIYSFGINYESSFEAALLENTQHCEIWGYDFSVHSFGPEIPKDQLHRAHFHAYGLAGQDRHGPTDEPKMWTLESLMKANGHTHIDILKVDIESWEFETLTTLVKHYLDQGKDLPFGQLQLEIHVWNKKFSEFLKWWETLEKAGLRPFWTEPNLVYQNYNKHSTSDLAEYSFINVKGNNVFISNPPVHAHQPRPPPSQ